MAKALECSLESTVEPDGTIWVHRTAVAGEDVLASLGFGRKLSIKFDEENYATVEQKEPRKWVRRSTSAASRLQLRAQG